MGYTKIDADWPSIESAWRHGASASQLASQFGVNERTIRSRARRNNWDLDRSESVQVIRNALSPRLKEPVKRLSDDAKRWIDEIKTVAEKHLAHVKKRAGKNMSLDDLDTLVKLTDLVDRIGRRQHGLDKDGAVSGPKTLVQVNLSSLADVQAVLAQAVRKPGSVELETVDDTDDDEPDPDSMVD